MALERLHRRRRTVALATIAAVAVLAIALVVSRLSGSQGTPPITGAPKDAVATVTEFETALAGRDWAGICNRLYTKRARAAAGGAGCVTTLAQSAGGLREPKVTIVSVTVKGQAATVVVSAAVNGKAPVQDSIQLVREGGRFRIASAGGD